MALETASNPTTGETVVLVNNEWIPAAETATNPDTGATAYLVNNKWLVKEPPPKAPASIRDTAVSLAQGVVGAGKSLSDVFGADTALSGALGNIQQSLGESYTPERQAELQRRAVTTEAASKSGSAMEEISAFLGGVKEAPLQSLMQGMGSLAPYVATGLVGLGAKTVAAVNTLVGLAQGAGTIKGTLYDNVKAELIRQKVSPAEAEARAAKAQETLGENFLNIAAGAGLGAAGARFGVESLLSKAGAAKANANLLPRVGTAVLGEAPLEGAQAGQEQYASNIALQREGVDTPAFQGVLGAAARDAAVGAMTAGTVGAVRGPGAPVPEDPLQAPFEVSAEDVTRRLQEEYVKRNSPVEGASTYGELKTKHKDFNTFMASPDATRANMDVWYAENEKRLATTDKNGPKAKALQRQQTKLRGVTPAPVAAPQAAAPTPLKIVRLGEKEPVVAPAVDPAAILAAKAQAPAGEQVNIYDDNIAIPVSDLKAPNANPNKTGRAAPPEVGSSRLAKSDGVPVPPPPAGRSRTPDAGGLGVGANQQSADKPAAGKVAQPGALKEEPYTFIKPSAGYDSFAKYAFKDENGVKYNISLNGDIHVELPPKLKSKFDNQNTIIFRNGDPRRNVYPADKLPLFVPPTVKDAIYAHVSHTALNGMGVDGIKKAVDATYAKRKGEEKTSSLKATAAQDTSKGKVTKDSEGMWHYDDADETAKGVGGEYGTTFKDPSKHLGISSIYIARNEIHLYDPNKTEINILFKDHKTIVYVKPNYDTDGATSVGFFENIKNIKDDPKYNGLDGMEEYGFPPKLAEAIRKTAAQITKDADSGKESASFDAYAIPFLYDTLGAKGLREIKKANSIYFINYQTKSGYPSESIIEAVNIHKETFGESIEPNVSLKATVVKPTAEEAAKQAAAEKQKQDQLDAIKPKRVIKKSEKGQAAADAKEAKRLAKKEADAAASAAAFANEIESKKAGEEFKGLPEDTTEEDANDIKTLNQQSLAALDKDPKTDREQATFVRHVAFLLGGGYSAAKIKAKASLVTDDDIKEAKTLLNKEKKGASLVDVRSDRDVRNTVIRLQDELKDASNEEAPAIQTALGIAVAEARTRGIKLTGLDLVHTKHIRAPRGSQGETTEPTGNTRAAIISSLKATFKTSAGFDNLVTVVQEESELPPDVLNDPDYKPGTRGVAYEGKVHLVASNIPQGRELGVLLHEAGAHIGFDRILSDDARGFLADKVRQWSKEGDVKGTAAKEALRKGGKNDDEVIAYMVEELVNAGVTPTSFRTESSWLRRVYAAFNKFLKNIGMRGDIAPQDLVDAAFGAAHLEMNRGELTGLKFQKAKAVEQLERKEPIGKVSDALALQYKTNDETTAKFREAAGLEPTEKISSVATGKSMEEVQAVRDQEIGAPKGGTRLAVYDLGKARANKSIEKIAEEKTAQLNDPVYMEELNASIAAESDALQTYLQKTEPSEFKSGQRIVTPKGERGTLEFRVVNRKSTTPMWKVKYDGDNEYDYFIMEGAFEPVVTSPPRFSVANPAILAGQSTADYLFRGPSAPRSLLDRAAETASGVRQNMANKLEWWTDKATRVYGNAATDATGEAALRDRIEAGSKVTHIALNKLLLGGLEKKNGFWQAVKTDASYQDMLLELEKAVGKYDGVNKFEDINRLFDFAATARREQELIKAGKMVWQTPEGIQPTLDAGTQARGVTPQIDEGMRLYNTVPEIKNALSIFEKFNNRGVDELFNAGVITGVEATQLKGTAGYVPWFRISQDKDGNIKIPAPRDYAKGLVNLSNLRDLEGAKIENFQINHVLDNMAQLSGWMTSKTIGNDTAAYMVDFATKFGVAGKPFAKKVGRAQANSVQVMQNGVPTYYAFDDPMAIPAFRGYESAHSAITEFLSAPANLVRMGVTAFPIFSVSQLPQDAMRAFIESDLKNPYALIPRIMGNFVKELFGGGTDAGKRLAQFGIVGRGGDILPGEARRSIRQKLGRYDSGMGGTAKKFWAGLERIQAASDAASRTALYELTMKETGNEALAVRKAREIINFDTQGASAYSTFLRQTVPFMGVSMIGLNNLYKGLVLGQRLSDKEASAAKRAIIYHGTQIAVLTMLYTMLVGDTEDYKRLSDTERNRNFIIPGTGLAIPVPGDGLGYIFKVIPEQIARYTLAEGLESKDMGSKAGRALWKGFTNLGSFESYIPVVGSPLPKTFVELVLNENWYTGNPIVGKSKEKLDPADQYTDSTSEIAKQLGKAMNLSPLKIDYVVRAMSGQMGGFVMAMSEAAVNSAQGKVTPSWDIRSFPGLNAFTYPDGKDRAALEDFYELRGRVDEVARTYTNMVNTGRGKEALAYLAEGDNKRAYALRQFQTQAELGLAKFRRVRTLIINDPTITDGAEMKRRLKELDDRENAYLKSMRLPDKREFAQLTPSFDPSILKAFR